MTYLHTSRILLLAVIPFMVAACSTETGETIANGNSNDVNDERNTLLNGEENSGVTASGYFDEQTLSGIFDLFSEYDRDNAPGCAAAIYKDGRAVFAEGFGMANLDHDIPLSDSSRFYMASVSKQVTAAAAGLLIVRGELDYDARVSDYLDDWPEWAEDVRVKHLFNHTSGLPDIYDLMEISGISLSNVMDVDDYMSVFYSAESLKNRPGSSYSYTNSGYTALAGLIEKISGESFSSFVEEHLLKPLGMTSTHFHDDRLRVIPDRVISYAPKGDTNSGSGDGNDQDADSEENRLPPFRQTYLSNFQGVGPGGLYSTLKDWQKWEYFWMEGNDLPSEFADLKQLLIRQEKVDGDTLEYALGLDVTTWQGMRKEGHSGNFMGFKTDVRRFPESGYAFLTLCNREDADPGEKNREMTRIVLKEPIEAFLKSYSGSYHNEELEVDYKLTVEDASLKLNRRLSPGGAMTEDEKDKWSAGSWEFVFRRDDDQGITGFVVSTGRAREVEFIRR